MRKKTILLPILFILFLGICYYVHLPDYQEMGSISFSNHDTRDTELNVIVYRYWDIDGLVQEIRDEHDRINGIPTTLELRLYHSKWGLRHGKAPFDTVVFKNE